MGSRNHTAGASIVSRVPRIALLTHTAALSGAEIALERLVDAVDRDRFEPVVFCFGSGPLVDRLRRSGVETHVVELDAAVASTRRADVGLLRSLARAGAALGFLVRLARGLRAADVDVIHAHSLKADLLTMAVAPLVGRPLLWHVHDRISPDYLPRQVVSTFRWLARHVPDHVIVNSWATWETLAPLRHWTLAYPGVVVDSLGFPGQAPASAPVVGMLGRIGPTKGQDVFLRAAALVRADHPGTRFRIIGAPLFGEDEYAAQVRALAGELGLADAVDFVGFSTDPSTELARLTAVVHASPVPEPFGQVVVEAMVAGVPVVVADAGGASEIVRDRGVLLGQISRPGDHRQVATGLNWILEHPDESRKLAADAQQSAARRFSIGQTSDVVMDVWDQLCGPGGPRRFGRRRQRTDRTT